MDPTPDLHADAGLKDDVYGGTLRPCTADECTFQTSGGLVVHVHPGDPTLVPLCAAHREVMRAASGWPFR